MIQLHGDEDAEYIKRLRKIFGGEIWKAVRAKSPADIEYADTLGADRLLIDSFVEGMVGGTGKKKANRVLNRAWQSKRQPGSTIKPISVYGPALQKSLDCFLYFLHLIAVAN